MKKWKEHWNELLPHEKKFEVASTIVLCLIIIVFVCDALSVIGVLSIDFDFRIIESVLLAAGQGCEAVVLWRNNRHMAAAFMGAAVAFGSSAIWQIVRQFI